MTTARNLNSMGRPVPDTVNGRTTIPFQGLGAHRPTGRKAAPRILTAADFPPDGNKRASSLKGALSRAGLTDNMTVSTHHHLRNGDHVAQMVFDAASELEVKDLVWLPSASFPCHASLIEHLDSGLIHHIEGSLNGPLGDYASQGTMRGKAVLRSHGGRYRAIQDGDVRVDIAVIAAPSADSFGNSNGVDGPSACGSLGFALADAQYADHVIVVTDNLVPFPCVPMQIYGNWVDQVVVVDRIGNSKEIVSGTTQITRSPERLLIAEYAACLVQAAGFIRDGFSFQAGAGGISLAFTKVIADTMRRENIRARFVRGGSNQYVVDMLEAEMMDYLLDGQTFDLEGVRSMRENPRHIATSPFTSYNYHGKGNFASMLDVAVLGATEIDLDFNANVATHSDGRLLHGLGGWQDALHSKFTILTVPTFRNRIPIVREKLTTLCGPGELIDAVVTERGIAINPRRNDLLPLLKRLPICSLEELKEGAENQCGGPPQAPNVTDEIIGLVEWVDGTVIDSIFGLENE